LEDSPIPDKHEIIEETPKLKKTMKRIPFDYSELQTKQMCDIDVDTDIDIIEIDTNENLEQEQTDNSNNSDYSVKSDTNEEIMPNFNINPDDLRKMSRTELNSFIEKYKKYHKIDTVRNFDIKLPRMVDSFFETCRNNWRIMMNTTHVDMPNHITKDSITLGEQVTVLCGKELASYLKRRIKPDTTGKKFIGKKVGFLDPFAGNGLASKIIYDEIKKVLDPKFSYYATDFQNIPKCISKNSHPIDFNLDCIDSIEKYHSLADILILICPPPYQYFEGDMNPTGFADYFAIKKWEQLNKKIVVFVGEMGRVDGSEGMYDYMMNNNSIWKLAKRKVLMEASDLFGRFVQREIFIFENSNFL
jgi:hypothetical protein